MRTRDGIEAYVFQDFDPAFFRSLEGCCAKV
jgi:hypothetical protein